jgi:hypothetical protein
VPTQDPAQRAVVNPDKPGDDLRSARAIPAVAVLVALISFSGNGHDETPARGLAHDTAPGEASPGGGTGRAIPGSGGEDPWPTWPESASVVSRNFVALSCSVVVYTTPEALWEVITTVRTFSLWYPHWRREADMLRVLNAVGDTVAFHRDDAPVGRSVVTWLDRPREIRIVHELADGRVAGHLRMTLKAIAGGVGFIYEETMPTSGLDLAGERLQACKRAILIKRLAEGE